MDQRLNIGIIGAGRIGRVHAESIVFRLPQAQLLGITDFDPSAAADAASRFDIAKVFASSEGLLNCKDIDAVLICSSTDTHARLIAEAASCGKHIFCEKPVALELAEIECALAAVEKAGVKLQIGFNRRFDANFARVRHAVVSGEIGTPSLMHIISRDPMPPPLEYVRVSGGIFRDMTIHDFDMARFLIGDEVETIYAAGAVHVDPAIGEAGDVDTALIVLHFRNGVIGTIDNSRKAVYGYDQRVELLGSKGKISTENCYPNEAIVSNGTSVARDLPLNFFMERYASSFTSELHSFVTAVLQDRPTAVTGRDGKMPVVMALAARRSYDEKRIVRLDEITA
jgi:myo-inositol 2-dehydrogenase/D-chiro-inositol 1-dehydrogenase